MITGHVIGGTQAEAEYLAQRQKHPTGIDAVARWCGRTPSHGWLFNDASSPAVALFGGENLAETVAPDYQVATPYPNKYGVNFTEGTGDRIAAGAAGTFDDDGSTSFGWLIHCRFGVLEDAALRGCFGKIGTGWYLLSIQADYDLQWYINDGTSVKTCSPVGASVNGQDCWIWCSVDRDADLIRCRHRGGGLTTDITGVGSLTNGGIFGVGNAAHLSSGFDALALYRFEGANAEGDAAETIRRIERVVG